MNLLRRNAEVSAASPYRWAINDGQLGLLTLKTKKKNMAIVLIRAL